MSLQDKSVVQRSPEDNLYVEGFAQRVFSKADKQDRAGQADMYVHCLCYTLNWFQQTFFNPRSFPPVPAWLATCSPHLIDQPALSPVICLTCPADRRLKHSMLLESSSRWPRSLVPWLPRCVLSPSITAEGPLVNSTRCMCNCGLRKVHQSFSLVPYVGWALSWA